MSNKERHLTPQGVFNIFISSLTGLLIGGWGILLVDRTYGSNFTVSVHLTLGVASCAIAGTVPLIWRKADIGEAETRLALLSVCTAAITYLLYLLSKFTRALLVASILTGIVLTVAIGALYLSSDLPDHSILVPVWHAGVALAGILIVSTVELIAATNDYRFLVSGVFLVIGIAVLHRALIRERKNHF